MQTLFGSYFARPAAPFTPSLLHSFTPNKKPCQSAGLFVEEEDAGGFFVADT
jgi:hypothetical protein